MILGVRAPFIFMGCVLMVYLLFLYPGVIRAAMAARFIKLFKF